MVTLENATVSQLADAIRAAAEETTWVPENGPASDDYYRQIALRTQGHLRRHGAIGQTDPATRTRVTQALARIRNQ